MEIERIELGDGAWVEIRAVVTRRMRKKFKAAAIKSLVSGNGSAGVDLTDPDAAKAQIMSHPEQWDLNVVDDAYLIEGISAWSFSGPVNLEALDNLPDSLVEQVLVRMRKLYAEPTEAVLKN